ncbi:hypothetical protein B0T20DRAFT_497633 [Sordaria brevicollis]|uniref:C3H1-type domain-containing protein n=1 Tax=Sordaria brevicollis TaxID=83679 RepID=A0AAE0UCT2_SORBR|nr:hypothetical protein B0T20DRAFT_497633 [Sordaria brevicollis]
MRREGSGVLPQTSFLPFSLFRSFSITFIVTSHLSLGLNVNQHNVSIALSSPQYHHPIIILFISASAIFNNDRMSGNGHPPAQGMTPSNGDGKDSHPRNNNTVATGQEVSLTLEEMQARFDLLNQAQSTMRRQQERFIDQIRKLYDNLRQPELEKQHLEQNKRYLEQDKQSLDREKQRLEANINEHQERIAKLQQKVHELETSLGEANRALEKSANNPPPAFACLIIDGDGTLFKDEYLSQGVEGGRKAARRLYAELRKHLESINTSRGTGHHIDTVMVKVYLSVEGLARDLLEADIIQEEGQLTNFGKGFTSEKAFFDFIDVGPDKENTYPKKNRWAKERIVVVETTTPAASGFRALKDHFNFTTFPDVFRSESLVTLFNKRRLERLQQPQPVVTPHGTVGEPAGGSSSSTTEPQEPGTETKSCPLNPTGPRRSRHSASSATHTDEAEQPQPIPPNEAPIPPDSQTKDSQAKGSQAKDNQAKDNQAKDNQAKDNQAKDNQDKDNQDKDNQDKDNQDKDNQDKDNQDKDNQAEDSQDKDNPATDSQAKDNQPVEDKSNTDASWVTVCRSRNYRGGPHSSSYASASSLNNLGNVQPPLPQLHTPNCFYLNAGGQRLDIPLARPPADDLARQNVHRMIQKNGGNFCNRYHLTNCERSPCPYVHGTRLGGDERAYLLYMARKKVCEKGEKCWNNYCVMGHHCPWADVETCPYTKDCWFRETHGMDLKPAYIVHNGDPVPQELPAEAPSAPGGRKILLKNRSTSGGG